MSVNSSKVTAFAQAVVNRITGLISTHNSSSSAHSSLFNSKQDTLVSGTSIKTINNHSLLGAGNISIQGGDGADGASVWNTSTAPVYGNGVYNFTISNLSGRSGVTIAVGDIIFYDTYYYIVSTKNTSTVDCTTRVSIKGADGSSASVTIVDNLNSDSSTSVLSAKQGKVLNTNKIETSAIATSFSSTTSDSKVPSEKLTKTELDKKITKASTATGLLKDDGTVMTSGTGSTNWAVGNHTHSAYVNPTIADNLTTDDATQVLSAKQGKVLNDMVGSAISYIVGSGS